MKAAALLALTLLGTSPASAQDAQAIIGRAARVYRSLASLRANFVQVIDNPMIDSAESKGTLV
jgi:outer membrane lipoprotein-sorting protein